MIAAVGIGAAAALVVIGAESLKLAANFQQGVNRLRTGAGDTQDSFAALSSGIEKVSVATGVLTPALTQAMYLILSSGQRGAQAFDTLRVAAQGAQIEQANVVDVANTLSGVMTNYGTKIYSATNYMNGLVAAVAHGKITLQDLATAMGPIDPIARSVGVSFADLAAAMTTQTNAMVPASRAATGLRFLMQSLENPTKKATDAMAALGLNSVKVADEMKVSLPGALQLIYDTAKKAGPEGSVPFNRAISDMVGGIRSFTTYTALTGPHMQDFLKNVNLITAAMKGGQGDVNGWAIAQSNLNVQAERANAALQVMGINLGTKLLPLITGMVTNLVPVITGFGQWAASSNGLAAAFQGVIKWVGDLFSQMGSNGTLKTIIGIFKDLGDTIHNIVVTAFQLLGQVLGDTSNQGNTAAGSATNVANAFKILADGVKAATGFLSMVSSWFADTGVKGVIFRDVLIGIAAAIAVVKVQSLVLGIIQLGVSFSGAILAIVRTIAAMGSFGTMVQLMTSAIGANIAAIGSLGGAALAAIGPFAALAIAIGAVIAIAQSNVIQNFATHLTNLSQRNSDAINSIIFKNKQASDSQQVTSNSMQVSIQQTLQDYHDLAVGWSSSTSSIADTTEQVFVTQTEAFKNWVQNVASTGESWKSYWIGIQQQMVSATQQKWNTITQIIQYQIQNAKGSVQNQMEQMRQAVQDKWNAINNILHQQIRIQIDDSAALAALNTVKAVIASIPVSHTTYINTVNTGPAIASGGTLPYHATGIFNNPFGHMSIIGERGPEMMWVPKGASIFPNNTSEGMLAGMGNTMGGQPVTVLVYIDGQQIGQYAGQRIASGIRVSTGIRR